MDCNRPPDWSECDDEDIDGHEGYGHVPNIRRLRFAELNMLDAIRRAMRFGPLYQPYYGDRDEMAIHYVKDFVRELRKRGLWPETAQLEAETRKALAA